MIYPALSLRTLPSSQLSSGKMTPVTVAVAWSWFPIILDIFPSVVQHNFTGEKKGKKHIKFDSHFSSKFQGPHNVLCFQWVHKSTNNRANSILYLKIPTQWKLV